MDQKRSRNMSDIRPPRRANPASGRSSNPTKPVPPTPRPRPNRPLAAVQPPPISDPDASLNLPPLRRRGGTLKIIGFVLLVLAIAGGGLYAYLQFFRG